MRRADEDLSRSGNPELTLAGALQRVSGKVGVVGFSGRLRREMGFQIGARARQADFEGEGRFVVEAAAGGGGVGGFRREGVEEREGLRRRGRRPAMGGGGMGVVGEREI